MGGGGGFAAAQTSRRRHGRSTVVAGAGADGVDDPEPRSPAIARNRPLAFAPSAITPVTAAHARSHPQIARLAPSGMAPSRTLLGTAPPLSHGSSRQAVLPEGCGVAPGDDALTWTSALGVSTHERLYAENVDRGGPDAAP